MSNESRANSADASDFESLRDDVAALKKDLRKMMEHLQAGVTADVGNKAGKIYGKLAGQGERIAELADREMKERPFTSLLIAFGIGIICDRLVTR